MTASVVPLGVFKGLLTSITEHVDECVRLSIVVDSRVSWHTGQAELGSLQIHGMPNEIFIVRFENQFTLLVRENLLAVLEKNVELLEQMRCSLDINRATVAVIVPNRFFQNGLDAPWLRVGCIWS